MWSVIRQPKWMAAGLRASEPASGGDDNTGRLSGAEHAALEAQARRYVRHVPWDLRLARWVGGWIVLPRDFDPNNRSWPRWRRIKIKLARAYPNLRSFLAAIFGPRVSREQWLKRMDACADCPALRIRLPARPDGQAKYYCASCGCPDWPLSELSRKNYYARHQCPLGRHPAETDWVSEWIAERERARARHRAGDECQPIGTGD